MRGESANSAKSTSSDMLFDEPRRLSIAAEGTLSAVEPIGRERRHGDDFRIVRSHTLRWCNGPSCEVEARSHSRGCDL